MIIKNANFCKRFFAFLNLMSTNCVKRDNSVKYQKK